MDETASRVTPQAGAARTRRKWPLSDATPALAALPTAPGVARAFARETLRAWRLRFLADDAELIVSELTGNAVTASVVPSTPSTPSIPVTDLTNLNHSTLSIPFIYPALSTPLNASAASAVSAPSGPDRQPVYADGHMPVVRVCLLTNYVRLLIEVWDQAPGVPVFRNASTDDTSGRGLVIVNGIACDWGWSPAQAGPGKVVWATLPL